MPITPENTDGLLCHEILKLMALFLELKFVLNGLWIVEDRMNKRFKNKIDFLVDNSIILGKWTNVIITLNKNRND